MATVMTYAHGGTAVERRETGGAVIRVGEARISLSMPELQELTCQAADVLDVWFNEQEKCNG